jgi:PAS domain S-box-containing protein
LLNDLTWAMQSMYQHNQHKIQPDEAAQQALSETKFHRQELRAKALLANFPDGASFLIDYDLRYLEAEGTALHALGMRPEDFVGKTIFEALAPDLAASYEPFLRQALAGTPFVYEHQSHGRWYRSQGLPLYNEQGTIDAVLALSYDITERKQTEVALQASEQRLQILYSQEQTARQQAEEANRLKDEFLATVSHELRTPLTAFLGYAELLQRKHRDEAVMAEILDKMVQSARAQAALIEDLLDISRIVSGKLHIELQSLDLITVIRNALDTVRPSLIAKQLQLHCELDPLAKTVIGDANRLQQVVWNLLSNAVKFTPASGNIVVRLAPEATFTALSVSDSGQGIHPEFLPFVFERFRQSDSSSHRAFGGLGLGLAIVRHLVELHGGTVEAASDGPGNGSRFTVRLPLADTHPSRLPDLLNTAVQPEEAQLQSLRGVRVLVVDDQPSILDVLQELLILEGATVQACANAAHAFSTLRNWRPDVLVSDIAMPKRDGYWLIAQIRALPPEAGGATPALALTAYVSAKDRREALSAGFQDHLPKPIDPVELCDAIVRLVQQAHIP